LALNLKLETLNIRLLTPTFNFLAQSATKPQAWHYQLSTINYQLKKMSQLALDLIAENIRTKNPVLDLGNCGLTELYPELLDELAKTGEWLEELILSNGWWDWEAREWKYSLNKGDANRLSQLPPTLPPFPKLHILIAAEQGISDCTPLAPLAQLNTLSISNNGIRDCAPLAKLEQLNTLDISGNQINDCAPLARLTQLKKLYVYHNQITDCAPLAKFEQLKELDISLNQITDCAPLAKLTQLKELYISNNEITDCAPLAKLEQLQLLNISQNLITDCAPLAKLEQLQLLNISYNQITDCAPLAKLEQLKELYVSGNEITDWAPLAKLPQLKELYISKNQITDCAPLAKLTQLNTLDISHNQITDCAPLAKLTQLNTLDISENQITDCAPLLSLIKKGIPIKVNFEIIFSNTDIQPRLYLYGNPITNPPIEILKQGNEAVIRYFESGQLRPLNECKLIFVGEGGVGKTSLMRRLVGQDFNPAEQTTHGINKLAWRDITNAQNENIRVNLWDFGGQHIQHSLHQFFFTERVIYVLVLNPRNDEKAGYWLDQIAALGKESKVLVVYNWKDEKDKEANYLHNFYELRKKYSQLPEPFLLSCKADKEVEEFSTAIKKAVLSHEGLKVQYPAKWFNIKARLEKDIPVDTSYIGYDTYQQWCQEADYSDPDAQKGLLKILDSIGSIVFFDKPVLNEYPVLNPEWITTGTYAILVAQQTKEKQGHLNWTDLKAIFKEKKTVFSDREIQIQFTEKQIYFILELMLSYNLCQKNPFAQNEYLIPVAFGEQPGKDYEPGEAGVRHYRIKFQSSFEMLIIHRFIAKNLLKITDKDYWQSGIYIKHPGSQTFALVETNQYSQEINCWIKGDNVRGFWEVIRNDFNEILSMYHNLPYAEEVWYEKDGKGAFLPYHEMMKAYSKGIFIIDYHPTYDLENINVLEVLELFEQKDNIISMRQIDTKQDVDKFSKEIDKLGNILANIPAPITATAIPAPTASNDSKETDRLRLIIQDADVKRWRRKALWCFLISILITAGCVYAYFAQPSFIMQPGKWVEFKKSDLLKVVIGIIASLWNLFIGKMVYERFFDKSKEKAFRDLHRVDK
jgi:internalin A